MGRVAQHLHARLRRPLQGALLLDADDGGRAHSQAHLRLHRHHPEEEEGQGVQRWSRGPYTDAHRGGGRAEQSRCCADEQGDPADGQRRGGGAQRRD